MEKQWSDQQKAIFEFFATGKGNLVVRARAGSGKTSTVVKALDYATHEPKILLAAFNKRIAVELTDRVKAANAECKTLHGLGFAYIRRQWRDVRVDANVDFDRARACVGQTSPDEVVTLVVKLAGLLKNMAPFATDRETVDNIAAQFDCEPSDEQAKEGWTTQRINDAAVRARDLAKTPDATGRISFDDMIFIPLACGFARPWFTMVVIDEAQDMNYAQLLLAQRACKRGGRIVVVGDDCQAIYSFRGADADGIDRLKTELAASELGLTVTYRCAASIVAEAANLVPDFVAAPGAAAGTVDAINIDALIDAVKVGDFVLSRRNAPLMGLCLKTLRRGVSARVEGRDVGAGLKALIKKFKARTVPEFLARVEGWRVKQVARAAKLSDATAKSAKVDLIQDQAETLIALSADAANVADIVTRIDTLFADADDVKKPQVVYSSVHKAKGLESDRAFVLKFTPKDREGRNILYVAQTRAKAHLTYVDSPK